MRLPKRVVYYDDPLNDDFAGKAKWAEKPLPKNYRFYHSNPFYWFFSGFVYYLIAIPVFWLVTVFAGFRIRGKRRLKKAHLGRKGYFVYGNHTTALDAVYGPVKLAAPRRSFLICSRQSMSKPFLRPIESMVGALPLPNDPAQHKDFLEAVGKHIDHGSAVFIFPEAHIWPYYTRIRPFEATSFVYPATYGASVIATCITRERRKFLRFLPPRPVMHVSKVFEPDMSLSLSDRAKALRDEVYNWMVETSSSFDNVEYVRYLPREKEGPKP